MDIPFLQASYFQPALAPRPVDLVVIHTSEVVPSPGRAMWLMEYCAGLDAGTPPDKSKMKSWHYAVDSDAITQSVREADVAYHAPGANRRGVGIELATFLTPSAEEWADPYHVKMILRAGWLVASICARWKIDPFFVDAAGLVKGFRGVTTHAQVTAAYGQSTHKDPGPDFPMGDFLAKVKARLDAGNFDAGGDV